MWSVPWHRHSLRGLFPAQVCSQTLTHPGLRPKHHRHHPETQNKTERRVKQDVKPRPAVTRFTRTSPARRHEHSLMSTASRPPHVTEHSNYNSALMILHICLYHTCDPRTMQWFRLEQRLVCVCVDSTSYSMPHSQQHFLLCSLTLTLILWWRHWSNSGLISCPKIFGVQTGGSQGSTHRSAQWMTCSTSWATATL